MNEIILKLKHIDVWRKNHRVLGEYFCIKTPNGYNIFNSKAEAISKAPLIDDFYTAAIQTYYRDINRIGESQS